MSIEILKNFHKNVLWDVWNIENDRRGYTFTLKEDPRRKAYITFKKRWIMVYQLVYDRSMTAITTYDNTTLGKILNDWSINEVFLRLRT